MSFYDYLKQRTKPIYMRLTDQYLDCYSHIRSLNPFTTRDFINMLHAKTKELKEIEKQIEECGGKAVAGVVTFNNKAIRKSIKRKS